MPTRRAAWRSSAGAAFLRPRTFVYTAIWLAVGLAMFFSLLHRERLDVNVLNDRNPLYVRLSDGSIRNGFTVKILNMEQRPRSFVLSAEGLPGSTMTMTGGDGEPLQEFTVDVDADKLRAIKVYVAVPPLLLGGEQVAFEFKVVEKASQSTPETRSIPAFFHAPPKETTP